MPTDDDRDDDAPDFGLLPPPAPEDRVWRHPSELGTPPAGSRPHRGGWVIALSSGLIGAGVAVAVVGLVSGFGTHVTEKRVIERVQAAPVADLVQSSFGSDGESVVRIAKAVSPSVARLEVATAGAAVIGSAVLYRSDGYLITNGHVVDDARSVTVVLTDGRRFDGKVVGTDQWTDIAVVKIDGDNFPVATLGTDSRLEAGQSAVAVGSPLGLDGGPSVTVGVISATGRRIDSKSGVTLHNMIQTDAPIAAGSSGGALCDSTGAVVGITTAVSVPDQSDAGASGLGFATPIDIAVQVADEIATTGSARHVWLGIEGVDVSASDSTLLGSKGGASISTVVTGGPADVAGLESGDVITRIGHDDVTSMASLVQALNGYEPGTDIDVTYWRDGEQQTATVTLGQKDRP